MTAMSGLLLIDKPIGPTSHDIVAGIRRKLGIRRVGHAGTLDPGASGLLVVCVGYATRLLEYMTADEKTYIGKIIFGESTETDDAYGKTIEIKPVSGLTLEKLNKVSEIFTGEIAQTVPKYSAVHINGKRAYELARIGEEFEAPTRQIYIRHFTLSNLQTIGEKAEADFKIVCSKGTYIRSICRDVGLYLNLPAHMGSLRRIESGMLSVENAVEFEKFQDTADPFKFLMNPLQGLTHIPTLPVSSKQIMQLVNGQSIIITESFDEGTYMIVKNNEVAMIVDCMVHHDGRKVKPRKVLLERRSSDGDN